MQTFLNWEQEVIGYETEEINKKDYVVKVWCRLCAKHAAVIKSSASIKGSAIKSVEAFIKGTTSVNKFQVQRHLSGDAHKISVREEGKLPPEVSLNLL